MRVSPSGTAVDSTVGVSTDEHKNKRAAANQPFVTQSRPVAATVVGIVAGLPLTVSLEPKADTVDKTHWRKVVVADTGKALPLASPSVVPLLCCNCRTADG